MELTPFKQCLTLLAVVFCVHYEASATSQGCSNPIPGVRKMVMGLDITELDIVPLELTSKRGIRNPVLNFTCNRQRKWNNKAGTVYDLPDQVWHAETVPGGWLSSEVALYKTSEDVRKSFENRFGGGGGLYGFSFSASGSYRKMTNTIMNESSYISEVSAFESATKINMIPEWVLKFDYFAQMYIDNFLTGTFETNPSAYKSFIKEFGTHYFSSGQFGGYIRVLHSIDKSYFSKHTDKEAKINAKASFFGVVEASGGHTSENSKVDTSFTQHSRRRVKYYGGDTNLLADGGIQKWQSSVDKDPWLFAADLKPISNLIKDQVKKSSMVTAVKQHVLEAYIADLRRLINSYKTKNAPSSDLEKLEQKLDSLGAKQILAEDDVKSAGQKIEYQLLAPDWFTEKTELCYQWRSGNGGQCGGGIPRLVCAKPNAMTEPYLDDTNKGNGGCYIAWSIRSTVYEPWFSKVSMCLVWHGKDNKVKCGTPMGGYAGAMCGKVNNFTAEYLDNTDSARGKCQMRFQLKVPNEAPLWMKASRVCVSSRADSNGAQCGRPDFKQTTCATSETFTPDYTDATDNHNGGCRVSWGLRT